MASTQGDTRNQARDPQQPPPLDHICILSRLHAHSTRIALPLFHACGRTSRRRPSVRRLTASLSFLPFIQSRYCDIATLAAAAAVIIISLPSSSSSFAHFTRRTTLLSSLSLQVSSRLADVALSSRRAAELSPDASVSEQGMDGRERRQVHLLLQRACRLIKRKCDH